MLFNWQIENTCVVFRWWHIHGPVSLIISCIAIFLIAACYEWIRAYTVLIENRWQEAEVLLSRVEDEDEQEEGHVVHAYQQHKK